MLRIVLNIPHSSAVCPAEYENQAKLQKDIATWTDFFTDELFGSYKGSLPIQKVIYDKSRFYCDCERLFNDPMELKGEGFYYTNFKGNVRKVSEDELSEVLLDYYKHQRMLGAAISGNTLLIDCHSFPGELAPDIDICLGYNEGEPNAPSEKILGLTERFFSIRGYRVARNKPYSNSITPLAAVPYHSMMIEVNKNLYLNADGSKRQEFGILQGQINSLYDYISNNYEKNETEMSKRPSYDNYIIKDKDLISVIRERMSQRYDRTFGDEWAEELLRACLENRFYEVRKGRWYQLAMWQAIHDFAIKYMPSNLFFETRDTLLPDVLEQIEAAGIQSTFDDECRLYYVWYKNKWHL